MTLSRVPYRAWDRWAYQPKISALLSVRLTIPPLGATLWNIGGNDFDN